MDGRWLRKRTMYLGLLVSTPVTAMVALVLAWNRVVEFLNGGWPPWVSNVANVFQIGGPIVALAWWLTKTARSRIAPPAEGAAVRALRLLALLLPTGDRERFVGEVQANMAELPRWWQRVEELLSVAGALPGLAVIVRWARRRRP